MTEMRHDTIDENDFDTVLSPDIDFSGTLVFDRSFLIQGRVSGEINAALAKGALVIAKDAFVQANIQAPTLIVCGTVYGNVCASERIEIAASGTLVGNISAPKILMESGCTFKGSCEMPKPEAEIQEN